MNDSCNGAEKKKIFDFIVKNGIDFINTAIDEIDKRPKYSLVHFCTGIELLLKARLAHEHWSLIVLTKNQGSPDFEKFMSGKEITLNITGLMPRIKKSINQRLPHDLDLEKKIGKIAHERNRAIHFYHPMDMPQEKKLKDRIISEQFQVWVCLDNLIENEWREVFKNHFDMLSKLKNKIKLYDRYLSEKYESLKLDIKIKEESGGLFAQCNTCKHRAFNIVSNEDQEPFLFRGRCLVCDNDEQLMMLDCPHCYKAAIIFFTYDFEEKTNCPECQKSVKSKMLLGDENVGYKEQEAINIYCATCERDDSVVVIGDNYFCCSCFELEDEVHECGYCGQCVVGVYNLDDSCWSGCGKCYGRDPDKN